MERYRGRQGPRYFSLGRSLGGSVQVRPRMYLDAGMDFGVTAAAPQSRVYGGGTFAVANVYWWAIPQR